MTTPRIVVSLTPAGQLLLELPGAPGRGPRPIPLAPGSEATTMLRILHAQLSGSVALGEDGSPTAQQVRHWERHGKGQWGDERCPFCVAEGRVHPTSGGRKGSLFNKDGSRESPTHEAGRGVKVTVLQGKGKARSPSSTRATVEDLGL